MYGKGFYGDAYIKRKGRERRGREKRGRAVLFGELSSIFWEQLEEKRVCRDFMTAIFSLEDLHWSLKSDLIYIV